MSKLRRRLIMGGGSLFVFLGILVALHFALSVPPQITVRNTSQSAIHNISIIGSGFSESIEALERGDEKSLVVTPSGESGLEIQFDAPKGRISGKDLAYFEGFGKLFFKKVSQKSSS